jgi:citrate synthase
MSAWIDRPAALSRLRVKAQTLYAYVSRGHIRVQPDPADSRRSLYNAADIASISSRKARGRSPSLIAASSMDWGEPAITTAISGIENGGLRYRGRDAISFAATATLEEAAQLLWTCADTPNFAGRGIRANQNAYGLLANLISRSQPILGRDLHHLARDAAAIIGDLALVCGAQQGSDPLHQRLARGWGGGEDLAERLRQALVLMADHDLNASTFAARVAASTGASLPAALLSGLCTLSGPRHGGAGEALRHLLRDARQLGTKTAVQSWLQRDRMLPGFGHNLYPEGDPRAVAMLVDLEVSDDLKDLASAVFNCSGLLPNCDYALAAIAARHALPTDAPFRLFLLGRAVGWCAHVMEQKSDGRLIRPRGRSLGRELPVTDQ